MGNLFSELKRRNVVRVGIAYVVLGWVVLQVADILFDMFEAPGWVGKSFAALLLMGFPFACLFAWAFELTPEGVKKTAEVDRSESITHSTGRRLDFIIIAALVVALGYFIWDRQGLVEPDAEVGVDRSIAVLPFVNMSSDAEQGWFADGLTEEILNSLARTPDLLVASRTASFQFKGKSEDVATIAATLGVAHILEGSVRHGGDRLRVTAQLIRASDGFHLWSDTFDREPEDVIAIQENVAIEIANALKTAMDPEALRQMVSTGTSSVAAYEAYLEGLALEGRIGETGDVEDWGDALRVFDRAVAIDADFALAHWHRALYWKTQLGITDTASGQTGLSRAEILTNFLAAIDAAIDGEEDEFRALRFRADKAIAQLRFKDAGRLLQQYVQEYPNDIDGLSSMFANFASIRDAAGAREHLMRLTDLSRDDPLVLNSLINNILFVGLVDEAVQLANDALVRHPQHTFVAYQAHRILLWGGQVDEARRWAEVLGSSEYPQESNRLVYLRQACAENDYASAEPLFDGFFNDDGPDISIQFIALQIMNKPEEAHQLLIDANLDIYALASFLNYPYFDHTYFPELTRILKQQSIDRPFINGPPYRCEATNPMSS